MRYLLLLGFSCSLFISSAQDTHRQSLEGKQFSVDDVKKASAPLNEMNAKDAFEKQLGREIQFFPDELEHASVAPGWGNCLVATIHTSFDEHRPLSLTPDVIWLAICQGVSIHINQNFKALESHIFKADKPSKIQVRNDSLPDGSVHWVDLLHAFSDSTTKYVNDDYYDFFVPEFSTTTNIELTSYEITMLEGFSQAFEYFGDSGCGIPYITLQGTREDWEMIYSRIEKIDELGMTEWAEELRKLIRKFTDVYDDTIDLDFWQDIYKDHDEYGGSYVSGWFIKLFPYLEGTGEREEVDSEDGMYYMRAPKIYLPNQFLEGDRYLISRLTTGDFPSGMAEITVHWDNYGKKQEMAVHAGFYGIKQYDDLTLEPAIAWAVRDKEGSEANHDFQWENTQTKHRKVFWSPHADYVLVSEAYYGSDASTCRKELKTKILQHLNEATPFGKDDLSGKTVELLISSKGTFLECRGKDLDPAILSEIDRLVRLNGKKWQPATADFRQFAFEYFSENGDPTIVPIPTNSWVTLTF